MHLSVQDARIFTTCEASVLQRVGGRIHLPLRNILSVSSTKSCCLNRRTARVIILIL